MSVKAHRSPDNPPADEVLAFAERHGLIIIIALGEAVVGLGTGASEHLQQPVALAAAVLILLVLLHSGKDAGMSGAFGVGVAGGSTGGSMMERNLDRWTILFAVLFAANTIALLKL